MNEPLGISGALARRFLTQRLTPLLGTGPGAQARGLPQVDHAPAVTLAVSKKPGENAIDVADHILRRIGQLEGTYIPEGVEVTVTRNHGVTANDKAVIPVLYYAYLKRRPAGHERS